MKMGRIQAGYKVGQATEVIVRFSIGQGFNVDTQMCEVGKGESRVEIGRVRVVSRGYFQAGDVLEAGMGESVARLI